MTPGLTIAVDAMGGDQAPGMVVRGLAIAHKRHPNVHFLLYGDETLISPLLQRRVNKSAASVITLHHTAERVTDTDKPSVALRAGRNTSMRLAIDAVADGRAAGVVSAGNTGALMVMSKMVLKTLEGIHRPAIASIVPTVRGEGVMLDLGANIQCDAQNLVQFALMGDVFARTVLGLEKPSIGILNVGEEDLKGHEILKEAATMLRDPGLPIHYQGFIEGNDIWAGNVDVAVTDGFTGNVALKTAEGVARLYATLVRLSFRSSLLSRLGYLLARPGLAKFRSRVDPRRYNGAMFLGLNGIAIKSHGGTDAFGFANAIGVAVDMASQNFNDRIIEGLKRFSDSLSTPQKAAI
jgi:glycerol-3-phosphate acyltransferase PlsX